jgi:ribonuclease G
MSKELIVSGGRHETRVAILEDDQVVELFHEREKEYSLAGSIHKGRVTRVLPGMQSAFVDIGLDRDAFLYVSDFFEDNDEYEAVVSTVEEKVFKMERGGSADNAVAEVSRDAGRADRPEPVRSVPVVVAQTATQPEGLSTGEPSVAVPAAGFQGNGAAEQRQDAGRDVRGDRGGRGRRGRRRRGGRASGLPDSKFFTPGAETARTAEAQTEIEPEGEAPPVFTPGVLRTPPADDDFMVLPGESLAKYSPGDSREREREGQREAFLHEEPGPEGAEAVPPVAVAGITADPEPRKELPVESALPGEHPLAGFGEVASWVALSAQEEPVPEEPAPEEPSVVENKAAAPAATEDLAPEAEAPEQTFSAETTPDQLDARTEGPDDEEGLSAAEVAEAEVADDEARSAEVFDDHVATSEISAEEGPEPARIPTSLTAALREQGHRYPHRVSRRMRRKMRGGQASEGQPAEERPRQTSDAAGSKAESRPESRSVAPGPPEPKEQTIEPFPVQARESGEAGEREPREPKQPEHRGGKERPERERPPLPSISDLLHEGQEIIVQIAKEPLGQKGARITSHIALPGRFVVYMPTVEHVGVSRKIPSDEERQRLKRVLQTHRQGIPGGFICRTAAENKSEEELKSDMHFLYNLWLDMRQKAEKKPAPVLLHHDLDLVQRILRDQLTTSFKTIWVDNEELFESILSFVQRFQPVLVGRVKLYTRSNPIFDEFGISAEVEKALRPKVWLKSGGYIVINQTEALVAIDINTGKYVGKSNRLEDTIVKINTDAIKEIVRQIRLRDLGGIIVVDFIDMDERKNRQKVMLALEDSMRADRAPYKILQFNDFGLVAITRKRVKQSLERTLCTACTYCEGARRRRRWRNRWKARMCCCA